MQLYWPHFKIAVTHTTATILEQSKIVALVCAALSMEQIEGVTHSTATILPFLPLLVLFLIDDPNQMLKNINSISVWQFWLNKVGSNVSLRHLNWWLKIKYFNLDLLSLCPSKILAVVRVTNEMDFSSLEHSVCHYSTNYGARSNDVFLHIWFLYTNSALLHFWKVCEKLLQFCSLNFLDIFSTGWTGEWIQASKIPGLWPGSFPLVNTNCQM